MYAQASHDDTRGDRAGSTSNCAQTVVHESPIVADEHPDVTSIMIKSPRAIPEPPFTNRVGSYLDTVKVTTRTAPFVRCIWVVDVHVA